jgi:ribosomal protein S18 acetylase RimI-like enzyme
MRVRRAKPADAKGIAAVHVAAWRSAYRGLLPDEVLDRLSEDEVEGRWTERIAAPWGHILVAEQADRIVGFAACGETEDGASDRETAGEIYVIYVHPAAWRQGYGTALLEQALRHLRADGFREAVLWVLQGNRPAIALYEAAGFAADGAEKVKRRADGTEMSLARYRRNLALGAGARSATAGA